MLAAKSPKRVGRMLNLVRHHGNVSNERRATLLRQIPVTIWLTGLSGAGKSTLAYDLDEELSQRSHPSYVLDGDNVRHGLNCDLGFSPEDRAENIRRVAEVAHMMNEAGLIVMASSISPYAADRELARRIIGPENFLEVHVSTSLAVCEQRDPKALYQRARRGEIAEFTGISAPYEIPQAPALSIDTGALDRAAACGALLQLIEPYLLNDYRVAAPQLVHAG